MAPLPGLFALFKKSHFVSHLSLNATVISIRLFVGKFSTVSRKGVCLGSEQPPREHLKILKIPIGFTDTFSKCQ